MTKKNTTELFTYTTINVNNIPLPTTDNVIE